MPDVWLANQCHLLHDSPLRRVYIRLPALVGEGKIEVVAAACFRYEALCSLGHCVPSLSSTSAYIELNYDLECIRFTCRPLHYMPLVESLL